MSRRRAAPRIAPGVPANTAAMWKLAHELRSKALHDGTKAGLHATECCLALAAAIGLFLGQFTDQDSRNAAMPVITDVMGMAELAMRGRAHEVGIYDQPEGHA